MTKPNSKPKPKNLFSLTRSACLCALMASLSLSPFNAQAIVVFDPSNYAQNILTAARALQQINNQIKSLQNEAQMLQNMQKNLKSFDISALSKINADLAAINELMKQAQGISFTLAQTEAAFKAQFPRQIAADIKAQGIITQAQNRWTTTMSAFEHTLKIQSAVDQSVQSDAQALSEILSASEASEGSLQAQQAANQLMALTAKQQMQIETLMAAQYRAETLDQARKAQAEAEGKAMTAKFLGTASAYTPQ